VKEKISFLLLFYISLGILAPSINLFFSNSFENNIVYISFEADGEADEKESEIEEKILPYNRSVTLPKIVKNSCPIFFDQNSYASVDQKYFKNKYRQLGESASIELLKNSSKTVSNIGSRFKSSISGIIINPKKDSINQNVLGTDSYAFAGLIRS